jgi:hypothetical protein
MTDTITSQNIVLSSWDTLYITRLASNEIFSPSNDIYREVGRARDLSAPLYCGLLLLRCHLAWFVTTNIMEQPAACIIWAYTRGSSDILVTTYQVTRHHNTQDNNINSGGSAELTGT